jgi:hypothetical protein
LRYNNEVQLGHHDDIDDGLSTLQFKLHGKNKNDKITHLNVGM